MSTTGIMRVALLALLLAACKQASAAPQLAAPTATVAPAPSATATQTTLATSTPAPAPTATMPPAPTPTLGPLSYEPNGRPIAVVVENEKVARPQTGLGQADVVYEAVAEWDLTRFVAVYSTQLPDVVGPVRSGRAYHAAIAAEYDAALAQCLSVPSQQRVLGLTHVVSLDGCRVLEPVGFSRAGDRRAPHNLYVNIPLLEKVAGGKGSAGLLGKREYWPPADPSVTEISFVYPEDHEVIWRYDAAGNRYLRWQDGEAHVDVDAQQISAAVVVVQFVDIQNSSYYGEAGYHELTLAGEGPAIIYAEGHKREATWRRPSLDANTHFLDERGEVSLPPGQLFVQLVAKGTRLHER